MVLEAVQGINELSLAQLGVLDKKGRERIVNFISQTTENTSEAIEVATVFSFTQFFHSRVKVGMNMCENGLLILLNHSAAGGGVPVAAQETVDQLWHRAAGCAALDAGGYHVRVH